MPPRNIPTITQVRTEAQINAAKRGQIARLGGKTLPGGGRAPMIKGKRCKKGKSCGASCIPVRHVCMVDIPWSLHSAINKFVGEIKRVQGPDQGTISGRAATKAPATKAKTLAAGAPAEASSKSTKAPATQAKAPATKAKAPTTKAPTTKATKAKPVKAPATGAKAPATRAPAKAPAKATKAKASGATKEKPNVDATKTPPQVTKTKKAPKNLASSDVVPTETSAKAPANRTTKAK
jgi:hypothetical protein